jgi:hypothetical protein
MDAGSNFKTHVKNNQCHEVSHCGSVQRRGGGGGVRGKAVPLSHVLVAMEIENVTQLREMSSEFKYV